jgi:hypothetical protein
MTNGKELHSYKVVEVVRNVALVRSIALLLGDVSRCIEVALSHGLEKRTL